MPEVLTKVLAVVLLLVLVAKLLPWREWLRSYFANDPQKGWVYLDLGIDVLPVKGQRIKMGKDGETYVYRYSKVDCEVDLGPDYPVRYIHGRRAVGAVPGERKAVPIPVLDARRQSFREADISALTRSRYAVQMINSLTGGMPKIDLKVILIGIVVLVGVWVVYTRVLGGDDAPTESGGNIGAVQTETYQIAAGRLTG